jgi:hypothetical protein
LRTRTRTALAAPALGMAALFAFAGPAAAADGTADADLAPVVVNDAGGSGKAMVQISGTTLPEGGVETGAGSTTGAENAGLIGMGALATVGGAALLARRRFAITD